MDRVTEGLPPAYFLSSLSNLNCCSLALFLVFTANKVRSQVLGLKETEHISLLDIIIYRANYRASEK